MSTRKHQLPWELSFTAWWFIRYYMHSHLSPDFPAKVRISWQKCFLSSVVRFTSPASNALVCRYLWGRVVKESKRHYNEVITPLINFPGKDMLDKILHRYQLRMVQPGKICTFFTAFCDLKDTHQFCPAVSDIQRSVSWCEWQGGSTPLIHMTLGLPVRRFLPAQGPLSSW